MRILAFAFASAALVLASVPAQAAAPRVSVNEGQVRVEVRFGDLNLATAGGAEVLVRRIHSAAETVCGPAPSSPRELGRSLDFRKCVRRTMETAVRQVPAPAVIAAYRMNWG